MLKQIKMSFNYKDIDKQVDAFLASHKDSVSASSAASLCSIYNGIGKTILGAVSGILSFFKPNWAQVVQILIGALDKACAQQTT